MTKFYFADMEVGDTLHFSRTTKAAAAARAYGHVSGRRFKTESRGAVVAITRLPDDTPKRVTRARGAPPTGPIPLAAVRPTKHGLETLQPGESRVYPGELHSAIQNAAYRLRQQTGVVIHVTTQVNEMRAVVKCTATRSRVRSHTEQELEGLTLDAAPPPKRKTKLGLETLQPGETREFPGELYTELTAAAARLRKVTGWRVFVQSTRGEGVSRERVWVTRSRWAVQDVTEKRKSIV